MLTLRESLGLPCTSLLPDSSDYKVNEKSPSSFFSSSSLCKNLAWSIVSSISKIKTFLFVPSFGPMLYILSWMAEMCGQWSLLHTCSKFIISLSTKSSCYPPAAYASLFFYAVSWFLRISWYKLSVLSPSMSIEDSSLSDSSELFCLSESSSFFFYSSGSFASIELSLSPSTSSSPAFPS